MQNTTLQALRQTLTCKVQRPRTQNLMCFGTQRDYNMLPRHRRSTTPPDTMRGPAGSSNFSLTHHLSQSSGPCWVQACLPASSWAWL